MSVDYGVRQNETSGPRVDYANDNGGALRTSKDCLPAALRDILPPDMTCLIITLHDLPPDITDCGTARQQHR